MAFQHQLKKLRDERELSMDELVNALKKKYALTINKSTISRWENGAEPRGKDLHYLAHYFNVSSRELMDLDLPKNAEMNTNFTENTIHHIPLYGSVVAGALAVFDGITPENVELLAIPRQFLGKHANSSKLFAMIVNGESMNKVIHHGSLVIAKPLELDQYKDGDLVIFSYNNEYSLKRYAPNQLEGYVLFKSESTDNSFKDIPFAIDVMGELKIYGKVVYYGNTL